MALVVTLAIGGAALLLGNVVNCDFVAQAWRGCLGMGKLSSQCQGFTTTPGRDINKTHVFPPYPKKSCTYSFRAVRLICAGMTMASQVQVDVEGDFSALEDNARIFVGEVEGRTADGLRRYASTASAR